MLVSREILVPLVQLALLAPRDRREISALQGLADRSDRPDLQERPLPLLDPQGRLAQPGLLEIPGLLAQHQA